MSRRVTITDVAREVGVSPQTVSRMLNNKTEISPETRARILEAVQRLGYRPSSLARSLVTRKTNTLGLVIPDVANPFFSEVAYGAEEAAHDAGFSLLLCNTVEDPQREVEALHTLEAQRVDGVLLCSSRLSEDALCRMMTKLPAVVLVNRESSDPDLRTACIDDEAGSYCAVKHLIAAGRRKIAFLAGPPSSQSGVRRALGYHAALCEAGAAANPELSQACMPHLEGGRSAAEQIIARRPDVDAFFCYNDLVAVGALQGCAMQGRRVPEDIAVVGCDDITLAELVTPALTTLRSDKRRLGAEAIRLLLSAADGCRDGCENVVLHPELIVRASAP
jgi:LacI family transcriptional regulator